MHFFTLFISHFILPSPKTTWKRLVTLNSVLNTSAHNHMLFSAYVIPNTHRRRDETVLLRRRCVHEFATSSRRLPTDSIDNLETGQADCVCVCVCFGVCLTTWILIDTDNFFNNDDIMTSLLKKLSIFIKIAVIKHYAVCLVSFKIVDRIRRQFRRVGGVYTPPRRFPLGFILPWPWIWRPKSVAFISVPKRISAASSVKIIRLILLKISHFIFLIWLWLWHCRILNLVDVLQDVSLCSCYFFDTRPTIQYSLCLLSCDFDEYRW